MEKMFKLSIVYRCLQLDHEKKQPELTEFLYGGREVDSIVRSTDTNKQDMVNKQKFKVFIVMMVE